uniref:Surface-adhesin protein E-like domain-containing protein n=1 Tax=uncultured marine microorganism HF4000_APKG2J17 TaxID=455546 RepID=B3T6N7_9ZZZZ|nr:hypothetical protein ALOHA_HF4000APKG2J17ctg1g53 [uncultured marine microorganism HF4000_APKG2J17]
MIRTLLTVLFLTVFSTPVFADWTKVGVNEVRNNFTTYYVDFERIKKHDGYVYYWELMDMLKPKSTYLSLKLYKQGDCKLFRYKILSASGHKEPMGGGTPSTSSNEPEKKWRYPPPNSANESVLKSVCKYAK